MERSLDNLSGRDELMWSDGEKDKCWEERQGGEKKISPH